MVRGETRDLLAQLKKNIIEEEIRTEDAERKRHKIEGGFLLELSYLHRLRFVITRRAHAKTGMLEREHLEVLSF